MASNVEVHEKVWEMHLKVLGAIATNHASLENLMRLILRKLTKLDQRLFHCYTCDDTFADLVSKLERVLKCMLPNGDVLSEFMDICQAIRCINIDRNYYLHSIYELYPREPKDVAGYQYRRVKPSRSLNDARDFIQWEVVDIDTLYDVLDEIIRIEIAFSKLIVAHIDTIQNDYAQSIKELPDKLPVPETPRKREGCWPPKPKSKSRKSN